MARVQNDEVYDLLAERDKRAFQAAYARLPFETRSMVAALIADVAALGRQGGEDVAIGALESMILDLANKIRAAEKDRIA